jgi:hypothetical protein
MYTSFESNLVLNYFSFDLQPLPLTITSNSYKWASKSPVAFIDPKIVEIFKNPNPLEDEFGF